MSGATGRAAATRGIIPERRLPGWARRIKSWRREGCDVYVYFDNDQKSAAPADALELKSLLGQLPRAEPRTHRRKKAARPARGGGPRAAQRSRPCRL